MAIAAINHYIYLCGSGVQEATPLLSPEQPVSVTVVAGPVVTEIRQTWASWASLTTRLYAGADTLEQVRPCSWEGGG